MYAMGILKQMGNKKRPSSPIKGPPALIMGSVPVGPPQTAKKQIPSMENVVKTRFLLWEAVLLLVLLSLTGPFTAVVIAASPGDDAFSIVSIGKKHVEGEKARVENAVWCIFC